MSLESESSTVSGDGHSTVSQETAIIRDPKEEAIKEGSSKRHSRFVIKIKLDLSLDNSLMDCQITLLWGL